MKRRVLAVFTALLLAGVPSVASQGPKPKAPKPQAASSPKPVKVSASVKPISVKPAISKPKATKPVKSTSGHGSKPTVKASKPAKSTGTAKAATKAVKPVKAEKLAKADAGKATTKKTAAATESAPTSAGGGSTPPDSTTGTTLTPVQQKLKRNTNLAAKLEGRLPKGTDLMTAAEGFRNLGQFVAAVNVSNNLDIPFADLKTKMVTEGFSLGQSIQAIKADADGPLVARRAETDAQRMIASTETQTASATATTTTAATATPTTTAKPKKPKKSL
jgi:hypothetical protein